MYEPGTILALREPQSTDDTPYPYDRVQVVGQSPVQHVSNTGSIWAGADATGYIIRALTDFAPTVDKPFGQLQELYEIESYPLDPVTQEPIRPENNPQYQPTPEQLLARAAEEEGAPQRPPRERTPHVQDNAKTPEQVLREVNPPKPARSRSK